MDNFFKCLLINLIAISICWANNSEKTNYYRNIEIDKGFNIIGKYHLSKAEAVGKNCYAITVYNDGRLQSIGYF